MSDLFDLPFEEEDEDVAAPQSPVSNFDGSAVRNLFNAGSISTPMTESCGPVIPTSVRYAVPFGRMRSSAVCTCVCVPTTAVTLPSRCQPIAIFSEVASA